MKKLLRRIEFPEAIQTSGAVIKSELIRHVKHYDDLINRAHEEARQIIEAAEQQAEQLKASVRERVAQNMQADLNKIKQLCHQSTEDIKRLTTSLCVQICSVVIQEFVDAKASEEKISLLVKALVDKTLQARELTIQAHPQQIDLVNQAIGDLISEQFKLKKWNVVANDDIQEFELRIQSREGSEIQVSLTNLIALYRQEIEKLSPLLSPKEQLKENQNESVV